MAHELAVAADGSAAMFSVGDTPWHRLGRVLDRPPSTIEALTMAGANFQVGLRAAYADVRAADLIYDPFDPPATGIARVEGRYATVRLDTMQPLGIVSDRYTPLQNQEAFAILDPLVEEGRITLETGGVLREGADVWIMAHVTVPPRTETGEKMGAAGIEPYFLLANNHDGRRGVLCSLTPIRVVCANTLGLAERLARKNPSRMRQVRHVRHVASRVREAAETLLGSVFAQLDGFLAQKDILEGATLDDAAWESTVLKPLAPLPVPPKNARGQRLYERHLERAQQRRERLTWLWEKGPGHRATRSAWEAYQAVTHSIDHDDIWSGDGLSSNRLKSLLDGYHAAQKQGALERLFALASEIGESHN